MYGLSDSVISELKKVFSSFDNIKKVILFGSRAKGDFREGSDIDFAFVMDGGNLKELLKISLEIDKLELPYEVDMTNYDEIENKELKRHIDKVGIVFWEREENSTS